MAPFGFLTVFIVGLVFFKLLFHPIGFFNRIIDVLLCLLIACGVLLVAYFGYWLIYYLRVKRRARDVKVD